MKQTDNLKHKSIRVEVEVRIEVTIKETIRIGTGQIVEIEDSTDKTEVGLGMNKILGEVNLGETLEVMVDKIVQENTETGIGMTVMTKAGTSLERGCSPKIMAIIELEVQASVGPGQDPELAQIGIEFIVISVGNTIILQGTVPLLEKKRKLNNFNEC